MLAEPRPLRQPGPPIWIGSWGSEAGLRRTDGPSGRRLARLRLQHDTRSVRRREVSTRKTPEDRGQEPRPVPKRHRDDVLPHDRRSCRGGSHIHGRPNIDAQTARERTAPASLHRSRRRMRREARRLPIRRRSAHHALARQGRASPAPGVPRTRRTPTRMSLVPRCLSLPAASKPKRLTGCRAASQEVSFLQPL